MTDPAIAVAPRSADELLRLRRAIPDERTEHGRDDEADEAHGERLRNIAVTAKLTQDVRNER